MKQGVGPKQGFCLVVCGLVAVLAVLLLGKAMSQSSRWSDNFQLICPRSSYMHFHDDHSHDMLHVHGGRCMNMLHVQGGMCRNLIGLTGASAFRIGVRGSHTQ